VQKRLVVVPNWTKEADPATIDLKPLETPNQNFIFLTETPY
jgi:hypothetical protein